MHSKIKKGQKLKQIQQLNNNIEEVELITKLLLQEYGYNLSKNELSCVLRISKQTIDRRIKDHSNIPQYKRSGNGTKSIYLFPVVSVANFIVNNNVKIY